MIDPTEHPMLLAEPPLNSQQQREKSGFSTFYRCWVHLGLGTDYSGGTSSMQ